MDEAYQQFLPTLALSIERGTPNVPDDGAYHLRRDGVEIGSYRSLKAAQKAWRKILEDQDWKPLAKDRKSPSEMADAERRAADRDARNEYWHSGRRHAW
jgi:hypothetical protein